MKRLALVTMLSFVTLVAATGAAAPPITARAVTAVTSRVHPQVFIPPAANRTSHGGQPSGRFTLANASGGEVPSLRTRTSRTYATGDGNLVAKIAAQPINYLDASGHWQPIDNTLVPTAGGLRNKGNAYHLALPAKLGSGPIRIALSDAWIEYELVGADSSGVAAGSVETYANALPGVTLKIAALDNGVKESLTLRDLRASQTFIYRLRTSPGLRPTQQGSEIAFFDTSGAVAFTIAAPTIQDSAGVKGSISQRLVETVAGTQVELSVLSSWLASGYRKWPVVVDPTVMIRGGDCTIGTDSPNAVCDGRVSMDDAVGWDGKNTYRTILNFNVSSIPANSQVLNADLGVQDDSGNLASLSLGVYQLTRAQSGSGPTWNTYDGTHPWSTPGGDFSSIAAYVVNCVASCPGRIDWYPTRLVQSWVNGTVANDGVIIKQTLENVNDVEAINSPGSSLCTFDPQQCWGPYLTVVYEPWTGKQRFFTFDSHKLTDRLDLAVNVANGNLVFHANDFSIHGTGLDLTLDRWYNSQADTKSEFGPNWVMGTGRDVGLVFYQDGSAAYFGPSGYQIPFIKNASGTFSAPTGIDATLTQNSDGTFMFLAHQNGTKENFSAGGFLTSQVDQNGNKISFGYNADNTLASITDSQGRVTSMTYASGLLAKMIDPAARTYQFSYDASSRLAGSTDPAGGKTRFAYDSASNLSQITDPNGNQTRIAYTTTHQVSSITYVTNLSTGSGYVENFTYNPGNTVVADANGNKTTYYFDTTNRVTKVVDALGNPMSTTYSVDSNPLQTTDPTGGQTSYTYDSLNNLTLTTSPTGAATTNTYSDGVHPYYATNQTDTQANATAFAYNAGGTLAQITDPTLHVTSFTYNVNGTLATTTDPLGNVTSYAYDTAGNLAKITYPAPLGAVIIGHDSLSRLTSIKDGKGQQTTYAYDALDRLTQIKYADGGSLVYGYDGDGNRTSLVDGTGTTTYTYDALNRQINEALPNGQAIAYSWDGAGNLLTKSDSGGLEKRSYNSVNELATVTDATGAVTTFAYDAGHRNTQIAYPNGVTEAISYLSSGQVLKIGATNAGGTALTSFTYSYVDPATNLATLKRYRVTDVSGNVTAFTYDSLDRLTSATKTSSSGVVLARYSYAYDALGNISSQTINGTSITFTYNAADELTNAGAVTYTSDADGNLTGNTLGLGLSYNAANQTTSVTPVGGTAVPMTYTDAGQGQRVSAGSSGFQYDLTGLSRVTTANGPSYIVRLPNGAPLSERTSTGTYYYLHDALQSVVALTDVHGAVVNQYDYDPYGNAVVATEAVANPFRWTGALWDGSSQLYKLGLRYYAPAIGRFTQPDPSNVFLNRYGYAGEDPIDNTDPSGALWVNCNWGPGCLIVLNGWETGVVLAGFAVWVAFWTLWMAVFAAFWWLGWTVLWAAIFGILAALGGWDAAIIYFLNTINGGRGVWIWFGWWVLANWGFGWGWAGCNGCWWSIAIFV